MRVLLVTLDVFGGTKKGGGERYVTELARALRKRGLSVEIAVVRSMNNFSKLNDLDSASEKISFTQLVAMVRASDLVHVHQLNAPGFDYAAALSTLFRKPLILTDHGGGALALGRGLGRTRLHLVSAAGFVSRWSQTDVDPNGIIPRTAIILGGGDHLPSAPPFPERYDFGFVGRLVPHKGLHIVLEALPAEASLIVAGQPRDADYRRELSRLADGKQVTFAEDASDTFVASLHRSIGFLLVPSVEAYRDATYSRPELLGIVALEALSASTPVIGSDVGGLAEVLRTAGQLILPPGDVEAWRTGLARALAETPPAFQAHDFTWGAVARKCAVLYETALLHRHVGRRAA